MRRFGLLGLATIVCGVSSAQASISFSVAGLAGTGVTADVQFSYVSSSDTAAALTISLTNTVDASIGARISAFAFNIPTIGGTTFSTISGMGSSSPVTELSPDDAQVIPDGSSTSEAGWFGLYRFDGVKTPNSAGFFDFGVLNDDNEQKFITDGVGSGPRIDSGETTTFTLNLTGTGLQRGDFSDADFEAAFLSELSSGNNSGHYNFAVRFQGIGLDDDSDLAVVPIPGTVVLAGLGLAGVASIRRRSRPVVS